MQENQSSNNVKEFSSLARRQFWEMFHSSKLDLDDYTKTLLLPQSVLGRAIEGHGVFRNNRHPEATMESIISSIGMNSDLVKYKRQLMVDDFFRCINNIFDGKTKRLVTKHGAPIYGIDFLKDFELELDKETFKGAVIAGRMDSIDWRLKTLEHYSNKTLNGKPLELGGGKEFPIDILRLREMNLSLESLANENHSPEIIQQYKSTGVITNKKEDITETAYIRYQVGKGTCDDAALIRIGVNHGISAMLLGFCIDATDTYGKFIENIVEGGIDEFIGEHIAKRWKEKYNEELVTPEECMDIIYFAAKRNYPEIPISSSHRRFIQSEAGSSSPTFVNHLKFIQGEKVPSFKMGMERIKSKKFYTKINQRLELTSKR
jgi:hypothetical protein